MRRWTPRRSAVTMATAKPWGADHELRVRHAHRQPEPQRIATYTLATPT